MKKIILALAGPSLIVLSFAAMPASARVADATAERLAGDKMQLRWSGAAKVDVYAADRADADIASARLLSAADVDGGEIVPVDAVKRPYFLLRDRADNKVTILSERLVPLAQGSNFRDLGGYRTKDGKQVKWGLLYRSGGSAMLTADDKARVQALGLRNMVDLRSDEERQFAPSQIDGVPYSTIGYSMAAMIKGDLRNGGALYRNFPEQLAPQLRILFDILKRNEGPVEYNCSAGQDRTGFASAMILSALGVPRDVILADYHLSTSYRQPQYEVPPINAALYPDNPVAQMFARYQNNPAYAKAQPLKDADGKAFLASAFEEIDARWGSVDNYLKQEIGVTAVDIAALKRAYLQ
ncbi:tyrosine-protein phosphatase [Sphingobium sp.]|uniref:tyrosine-protein phosphatase n=1 Tax=Sphingobium TaxID=165695 RepID=UPI001A2BD4C9|nr:tyrosine-protein phosphatase [Sphingobium sp.]MBJ7376724.1 tyrosine-protein phosphatase [Sphingobium sp.]